MEKRRFDFNLISSFLIIYLIAEFLELFFNREFLVSVLPFGLAGISINTIEPALRFMYIVGGSSYALLLFLQPILLGWGIYVTKGWVRALLASVLLSTFGADLLHTYIGINSTALNLPYQFSMAYVLLIVVSSLYIVHLSGRRAFYVLLIPDLLAFSFLWFDWLSQGMGNNTASIISAYSGYLIAYSIMLVGIAFTALELKRTSFKTVSILGSVGALVAIATLLNVIPGWGFAIGVAFPYIFGILGIRDWMPPIIFLIAFITLGVALGLRKSDKALSFGALSILAGTVIFDSVPLTTYMLAPLMACLLMFLISNHQREKIENKMERNVSAQ